MDKVEFIEIEGVEHAIIDRGNGEFTSMTKAHYEELEAAKEIKADEAKAK
jgi:translation elongation factor P/translation initiation factor 5A